MLTLEKWAEVAKKFPAKVTTKGNIRSTLVHLSFVELFNPQPYKGGENGGKPRFQCTLLLPPGDTFPLLDARLRELVREAYGEKTGIQKAPVGDKIGILAGGTTKKQIPWPVQDQGTKSFDGYVEGSLFVAAYQNADGRRPFVLDASANEVGADKAGNVYAGCFGLVTIQPYVAKGWDNRLCIGLTGVQKILDGDAFGAGPGNPRDHSEDYSGLAGDIAGEATIGTEAASSEEYA